MKLIIKTEVNNIDDDYIQGFLDTAGKLASPPLTRDILMSGKVIIGHNIRFNQTILTTTYQIVYGEEDNKTQKIMIIIPPDTGIQN
jgi:hypothetical protein